jgi:hypothetical protein
MMVAFVSFWRRRKDFLSLHLERFGIAQNKARSAKIFCFSARKEYTSNPFFPLPEQSSYDGCFSFRRKYIQVYSLDFYKNL